MKNFILGVLTCALLSFTSIETGVITTKPAMPKSVFVKYCAWRYVEDYVIKYTKLGYKYHSWSGDDSYGVS